MKVCQYCGTPNRDDASECVSCTGNVFKNQCVSCGATFEGAFCPACGVRVGTKPKTCPHCQKEYFTNACPDCGYMQGRPQTTAAETTGRPKRRHTALWVLGWIFCFPIPLTILLARSKKLSGVAKALLIALTWILFVCYLSFVSEDEIEVETPQTQIVEQVEPAETQGQFTLDE